jgi:DNA-binding transcriptional MocR family regulator
MTDVRDQSNSQSVPNGLKRTQAVTGRRLGQILGEWSAGADPLNEQLAAAIARAIERGDLPAGTRLPAERELATEFGLSRTTIVAAYDRLRQSGLVRSRQGSGTRVTSRRPGLSQPYDAGAEATGAWRTDPWLPSGIGPGGATVGLLTPVIDEAIELTIGALPASPVVAEAIGAVVRDGLETLLADTGYDPFGHPPLRAAIATHLSDRGIPTDPDEVIVTSGAQQALHLIGSQLGGPDASVLLENPTYIGAVDAFRSAGNRLVPIPTDAEGARVEVAGLLAAGERIRLAYVIPTFHNPTGAVMPEERRHELVRIAGEAGFRLVEDLTPDTTLGRGSPPSLAALDPSGRVITVGSLSKIAWGGLRIGWIRASRADIDRLVAGKIVADHSTSLITQAVAAHVFERIDESAARARRIAAEHRDILTEALTRRLPDWTWVEPQGGLALWVRLPDTDAVAFSRIAANHGVIVRPGPLASPDGGFRDHVRIAFGAAPDRLVEGVDRLATAWAVYTPVGRSRRPSIAVSV